MDKHSNNCPDFEETKQQHRALAVCGSYTDSQARYPMIASYRLIWIASGFSALEKNYLVALIDWKRMDWLRNATSRN